MRGLFNSIRFVQVRMAIISSKIKALGSPINSLVWFFIMKIRKNGFWRNGLIPFFLISFWTYEDDFFILLDLFEWRNKSELFAESSRTSDSEACQWRSDWEIDSFSSKLNFAFCFGWKIAFLKSKVLKKSYFYRINVSFVAFFCLLILINTS